jgi:4-methylaminobutanoate oxidase (formaldehyde-forming)
VRLADVTGQYACIGLWGPKAREVLATLTPHELSNATFPYLSMREITVGDVPVRAVRVTFVGELGWELYCSAEYGAALWRTVWEAGQPHGLVAGGYRAIESLRLEKGYRVWGADIGPETNPDEAGLGVFVRPDKPGGFIGREALLAARERGVTRRLCCFTLDEPRAIVLGGEPVLVGDAVLGRVTSGGYGYTVGRSIGYAYLPVPAVQVGTRVAVEIAGNRVDGVVNAAPLYDPKGVRIRADVTG